MSKIQLTCSTLIKSLAAIFRTFQNYGFLKVTCTLILYMNAVKKEFITDSWYKLIDARRCFPFGVHIVLGIDIQQTSFIFCKNAEGVKTISFLYQDCCIILIQHIRSFFLLMEFEASEYVLDFTNHGRKIRNKYLT